MKKIQFIILLCVLLIEGTMLAQQQVSYKEAASAAINTLSRKVEILKQSAYAEIDTINCFSDKRSNILMYEVVFKNRATILLSGSKACMPVLGYYVKPEYDKGAIFDTTNINVSCCLHELFKDYIQEIKWCFSQENIELFYEEQWNNLQNLDSLRGNPPGIIIVQTLLKTKWNQSSPKYGWDCGYNYYVTKTNNSCDCDSKHCAVGCVAVAMGQIMKYWNHPVYTPSKSYQYDWCNMPDELRTDRPNYFQERDAVARLLKDCGVSVDMDYCINNKCESGAYSSDVCGALVYDFGYDYDATFQIRHDWSDNDWKNKIKDNLNQDYPVYYSGSGSGGHAFVCDGYDDDDYFHFNWGWGGYEDNWFTLNKLNPGGYSFNKQQKAIFNIHPNPTTFKDYCSYSFPLYTHYFIYYVLLGYNSPPPYKNVPKFPIIESVPEKFSESWRTIESGQSAVYAAHEEVRLLPGFHAKAGSNFIARIEPCLSCQEKLKSILFININDEPEIISNSSDEEVLNIETDLLVESNSNKIKLFPNPSHGTFQIETNFPISDIDNLKITNLLGVPVYESQNITSNTIQLPKSVPGLHFVIVFLKDGTVLTQKMMIQK